jgi:hypothetical protein
MIPRSKVIDLLDAIPPEFQMDGGDMVVDIASECTWHIKAILGSRTDVAGAVPPIPAMARRWWEARGAKGGRAAAPSG